MFERIRLKRRLDIYLIYTDFICCDLTEFSCDYDGLRYRGIKRML